MYFNLLTNTLGTLDNIYKNLQQIELEIHTDRQIDITN